MICPHCDATVLSTSKPKRMVNDVDRADYNLGWWLAGALEDPNVCAEMKDVISKWFEAHQPGLVMPAALAATPAAA